MANTENAPKTERESQAHLMVHHDKDYDSCPTGDISLQNIQALSSSQEYTFIQLLLSDPKPDGGFEPLNYNNILNKLFTRFKYIPVGEAPSVDSSEYYLKNKYLYMFTEGAISYLQAYKAMENDSERKAVLYKTEVDCCVNAINNFINSPTFKDTDPDPATAMNAKKEVCVVSLGAGHSSKEIEIFEKLHNSECIGDNTIINYYPIDVSTFLLQIGMRDFEEKLNDASNIKIKPGICDFWNLAQSIKNPDDNGNTIIGPPDQPKIFLFLGATFGNYFESDVLDAIISVMKENEMLIVGVDTYNAKKKEDEAKKLYKDYNILANIEWLVQPLKYVPFIAGYVNKARYLSFDIQSSILQVYEPKSDDRAKYLTAVKNTICFSPLLRLNLPEMKEGFELRVATTTKYDVDQLKEWFRKYKLDKVDEKGNNKEDYFKVSEPKHNTLTEKQSNEILPPRCAVFTLVKSVHDPSKENINSKKTQKKDGNKEFEPYSGAPIANEALGEAGV